MPGDDESMNDEAIWETLPRDIEDEEVRRSCLQDEEESQPANLGDWLSHPANNRPLPMEWVVGRLLLTADRHTRSRHFERVLAMYTKPRGHNDYPLELWLGRASVGRLTRHDFEQFRGKIGVSVASPS
ncbi:hypothetical protein ACFE04_001712 [Oxalis oulophora]